MTQPVPKLPALAPRVLKLEEAAAYLGTNRNVIYDLTRSGELSDFHLYDGGPRRWLRDELDAHIERRRAQAQPALTLHPVPRKA